MGSHSPHSSCSSNYVKNETMLTSATFSLTSMARNSTSNFPRPSTNITKSRRNARMKGGSLDRLLRVVNPAHTIAYSQSMCSVRQWKSYQAAEAMVSAEVEEVRAEADEIEPGWSQVVWRQAMQYNNMLKQKEEQAKNQLAAQQRAIAEKQKAVEEKKAAEKARYDEIKRKVDAEKARIANAEKATQELLKQEEREKASKQAFSGKGGSGMKKGFLG